VTRRTLGVLAATVAAVTAACGGGGDGDDDDPGDTAPAVDARLDVDVERVDTAVHVAWTVTNHGDEPLLVFDNRRGDEAEGELLQAAYVTGGDDGDRVEVSRRVFPVPDDLEGAQDYVVTAGELAPGASESYVDNVAVPPRYAPAASEGGGAPLPDDATTAVFCVGVAPVDAVAPAVPLVAAPGRFSVPHSEDNAAAQTLLCSDPFDL
jgi:hypothetical protein